MARIELADKVIDSAGTKTEFTNRSIASFTATDVEIYFPSSRKCCKFNDYWLFYI